MKSRILGATNLRVSEIGLGCMGMSEFYGETNEKEALTTLHRAFELGVNFYDTADMYGKGANEELLAKAFKKHWNKIVIATKCGIVRHENEPGYVRHIDGSPEYIKKACDASLKRLGIDVIDLYYLHRADPNIAIEESMGALNELVHQGKIRYVGLSEVDQATLERALKIHPITALQSEYSLWTRGPERNLISYCEKHQISFIAYCPLGRGFLTNKIHSRKLFSENDFRLINPRFDEDNLLRNIALVEALNAFALTKKATAAQIALAWILAQSKILIPIPGTKRVSYLEENVKATEIELSAHDLAYLNDLFKPESVSGARYTEEDSRLVGDEEK